MPKSEHMRAALEDEALEICEMLDKIRQRQSACDCDLGKRCIWHRAQDWLRGYDDLIALIAWEEKNAKEVIAAQEVIDSAKIPEAWRA